MDNDRDVVEKAARYIFYIIYDEARSRNGSFGLGIDNWPQNRLSRVGVGILPGLLFPSLPFHFQSKAEVRHISEQVTRWTFTQTCGTFLYSRCTYLLKAF